MPPPDSGPEPTLPRWFLLLAAMLLAGAANAAAPLTDDSDPWGKKNVVRNQGVQDGPDIIGPYKSAPDLKKPTPTITSTEVVREVAMTPSVDVTADYWLWACFDSSKDCGDVAERFCAGKNSFVSFQSYDPTAETPCRFTCGNGEGGTCKKEPETASPKPKPGDVTTMPANTQLDGER